MPHTDAQTYAIEVESLSVTYRDNEGVPVKALQNLCLSIPSGQICGLVGPNGAGKTTVLRIIAGQVVPCAGSVRLGKYDLAREREMALQQIAAVMNGYPQVQKQVSVWDNLAHWGQKESAERPLQARAEYLLQELDLWEWRDKVVEDLSQGMQHKVAVACALITEPPILLLDEPTQYLDVKTARIVEARVKQLAREKNTTVLFATRQPWVAQALCDRVLVLRYGSLIADHPIAEVCDQIHGEFYRLKLKGEIDSSRSSWLGGMALTTGAHETLLSVVVPDQTALHGLLTKIRDLGIPLLSVERVEPQLQAVLTYLMHAPLDQLDFSLAMQ